MSVTPGTPAQLAGGPASTLLALSDLGPPSEIRRRAPGIAARALDLDRVLLTSIRDGVLAAQALHAPEGAGAALAALQARPVALDYPLVEAEIVRRRRAEVVAGAASPSRHAFADVLGWGNYIAAPILLDGRPIGFLHADRSPRRAVDADDAAGLAGFAVCFAVVFERAVLRHRLRVQRQEMLRVATWADARTSELGDPSIALADDPGGRDAEPTPPPAAGRDALRDLLTRREADVLELMVRGETNGGIARALVVSEGTVKFHVKNILRKLHAANRAEATSRYLRLTLQRGGAAAR